MDVHRVQTCQESEWRSKIPNSRGESKLNSLILDDCLVGCCPNNLKLLTALLYNCAYLMSLWDVKASTCLTLSLRSCWTPECPRATWCNLSSLQSEQSDVTRLIDHSLPLFPFFHMNILKLSVKVSVSECLTAFEMSLVSSHQVTK